ncbi:YceD family protein [Agarilytica rhodophyticola]|uniref:YceD family protein n=1 Tax=Agarilytica rhodophyticola TaxID=1737490 RepID=UPI000B3411D9|nr:YceD family protein [Agarilytica rhodophyticola]
MSDGSALQQIPRIVSPRKLAHSGTSIEGVLSSSNLEALNEVAQCDGEISVSLRFFIGEEGKRQVGGNISANLAYQCQRCLETMPAKPIEVSLAIAVVRSEEEAKQLPRALDPWVVLEEEADVYALIEEELLLASPVVSYHDYECVDSSLMSSGEPAKEDVQEEKHNPFSVLSSLKQNK